MKKILFILALAAGVGAAAAQKGDTVCIQHMPTFQGKEMAAFTEWVQARIRYPEEALRQGHGGTVNVQIIIQPDGSINNIKALGDHDVSLVREAIRVVSGSPRWTPGEQGIELKDGTVIVPVKPVPVQIMVPVQFIIPREKPLVDPVTEHAPNYVPNTRNESVLNYDDVPLKPTFQGGEPSKFAQWLAENVELPTGEPFTATVELVVSRSGEIENLRVPKLKDKAARAAIAEAAQAAPHWEPGGVAPHLPAAVKITVPVAFR